jgi:site-specific recombinase XerD
MGQKFQFNPQRYGRNKGNWRIRIGSYPNGSPKYFPCDNEEHAKREQRKRLTLQANNDVLGLEALKVSNAHDVAACVKDLAKVGATVREATDWFLKTNSRKFGNKTATEAGEAFLKFKRGGGLKKSTIGNYEPQVERFTKFFGDKLVNEITTQDLEEYVSWAMKGMSTNSIAPRIGFLRLFFTWLKDQGFIHDEKDHPAIKLVKPKRELNTPKLSTWQEAKKMLLWYDVEAKKREGKKGQAVAESIRGCMVHLVLILFCGVRREEACQVTWDDINLRGRKIIVLVEGSKKRKRRVNEGMEENFWDWIFYLKKHSARLDTNGDGERRLTYRQRKYRESFQERNAPVPDIVATIEGTNYKGEKEKKAKYQNIMRHSFISYHMKLYDSAGKTSRLAGNRESEVLQTYLEVVTAKEEATMWFMIKPPEKVSEDEMLREAIESGSISLEYAYNAQVQIDQFKEVVDELENEEQQKEIHSQIWDLTKVVITFQKQEPDNLHLLAKKMEWGEHQDDVRYSKDGEPLLKVKT